MGSGFRQCAVRRVNHSRACVCVVPEIGTRGPLNVVDVVSSGKKKGRDGMTLGRPKYSVHERLVPGLSLGPPSLRRICAASLPDCVAAVPEIPVSHWMVWRTTLGWFGALKPEQAMFPQARSHTICSFFFFQGLAKGGGSGVGPGGRGSAGVGDSRCPSSTLWSL